MTNDQRKTVITTLENYLEKLNKWVQEGRLNAGDTNFFYDKDWFIGSDRLKINREDGSCASVDQRFIDEELLSMMLEAFSDKERPMLKAPLNWDESSLKFRSNPARERRLERLYSLGYFGISRVETGEDLADEEDSFENYNYRFTFDISKGSGMEEVVCLISGKGWIEQVFVGSNQYKGANINFGHVELIDEAIHVALNLGENRLRDSRVGVMVRPDNKRYIDNKVS